MNAFLIDRGDGNDRYLGKIISTGVAEVRSNAFFVDEGGDDLYLLDAGTRGFGDVDERDDYREPGLTHTYPFHLGQVAIFLDLGGRDRYLRRDRTGALVPDPSRIARQVIGAFKESKSISDESDEFTLTNREKEVLTPLANGNNYQEIAEQLLISVDTVRHHIKNIYKKLHVHTQSEAVAKAIRKRII